MVQFNPLIALQTKTPDTGGAVLRGVQTSGAIDQARERKQKRKLRGLNDLKDAELSNAVSLSLLGQQIAPRLESGDIEGVRSVLTSRRENVKSAGRPTTETDEALALLDSDPKLLLERANQAIQIGSQISGRASERFNAPIEALDAEGNKVFIQASNAPEGQPRVLEFRPVDRAAEAGEKRGAVLEAELDKLPEVKAAIKQAESEVAQLADTASDAQKNTITFNMYETALGGLTKALSETETGPVAGRIPAVTAKQQIAEGAVSAMAPILKSMFRTAGEGTFTDKDQELLLKMVPTRKDLPEARESKVSNIDAIIRAKLGQSAQPQTQDSGVSQEDLEFTAQKHGITVDEVKRRLRLQ